MKKEKNSFNVSINNLPKDNRRHKEVSSQPWFLFSRIKLRYLKFILLH